MNDKEIYASLEVSDHEVRMVVGEFFNTRFNILRIERIPTDGLSYNEITNEESIVNAIKEAAYNVKNALGTSVKRVILAIPSYDLKRVPLQVTVPIEGIDGKITVQDIRNAIKEAQNISIGKEFALVQTVCVVYTVDGISARRMPIGEEANELTVDVELICADRQLTYSLVGCVEKAGLEVMEIFVDSFAIGTEASLFERSVKETVLLLNVERESTTITRFGRGKLLDATTIPMGVGTFAGAVVDEYGIKRSVAIEKIKYHIDLNNTNNTDNPVYVWTEHNQEKKFSEKDLINCIGPSVSKWLVSISKLCAGILKAGPTTVIITGEGGEVQGLDALLQRQLKCEVKSYIPETLGGRSSELTTCLGLFYAYKDKLPITGYTDSSLDMDSFLKAVSYRKEEEDQEETFTEKLRKRFLANNKK